MFIVILLIVVVVLLLQPKSFWKQYFEIQTEGFAIGFVIFTLVVPALFTWSYRPAFFYQQKTGTVINITESKRLQIDKKKLYNSTFLDAYIFNIDGKEIEIRKEKNENYDYLIGESIKYKSFRNDNYEYFIEITHNNQAVYSSKESGNWLFIVGLIVFLLVLSVYIFKFVKIWEKVPVKKMDNSIEETFFDNWGVRKKNDKCTLTYISKWDGNVKHIKINLDEYTAAKNGKMNLNDFSAKYNLW